MNSASAPHASVLADYAVRLKRELDQLECEKSKVTAELVMAERALAEAKRFQELLYTDPGRVIDRYQVIYYSNKLQGYTEAVFQLNHALTELAQHHSKICSKYLACAALLEKQFNEKLYSEARAEQKVADAHSTWKYWATAQGLPLSISPVFLDLKS